MSDLRQAAQQALEALVTCCAEEWRTLNNFGMKQVYDEKKVNAAIAALHAALAKPEQEPVRLQCTTCGTVYADGVPPQVPEQEPQTTHWEGCEAVHPECKKENT